MAIALRKKNELAKLQKASSIVAKTLEYLQKNITAGMTLKEIDTMGEDFIRSSGAVPSFKGLYGFPASVCTSLNEVCIHGVPIDVKVQNGDILGLDLGTKLDGYYGDGAITMGYWGYISKDRDLIDWSRDALYTAVG